MVFVSFSDVTFEITHVFFFQQVNFFFILLEFELKRNKDAEKM